MTQRTIRLPRTAVTFAAAAALAATGAGALATGWSATATPGDPHQVWVCKYVQKPHQNEVLKRGKNPILVDWAALTGRHTAPAVGDTFSDAQDKSVVVQIGGSSPGVTACGVVTPPTTTRTTPSTTTSTTTVPSATTTTTTTTTTTSTTVPTTKTSAPSPRTTVPRGGGGGGGGTSGGGGVGGGTGPVSGPAPGVEAPHTGGAGDDGLPTGLVGSGLIAGGLALAVSEAARRRRHAES